jgi:hypothetical protein
MVNITDHANILRNHVLDIQMGTQLTTGGFCATVRSTIYVKGATVMSEAAVDILLAAQGSETIQADILQRIRKALCRASSSQKVGDIVVKHMSLWDR